MGNEIGCENFYWKSLAQDRNLWHAIVNMVTNLRIHYIDANVKSKRPT
jgi:hypothetical protein